MWRLSATFGLMAIVAACGSESVADLESAAVPTPVAVAAGPGSAEPYLSSHGDSVLLSWLEPRGDDHVLRYGWITERGAASGGEVVARSDLFVNWADMPAVVASSDGQLFAHYLQRGGEGTYDYAIRVTSQTGQGWQEPGTIHDDGTPTEHGFASWAADPEKGMGLLWLDGRQYVEGPHGAATDEMTLRWRWWHPDASFGDETLLDARVCDCCQTGLAATESGWVAVYRDRSPGEVRDIHAAVLDREGWTLSGAVHADGWVIEGCPVNGPAIDARGDTVAVAWFTAANDRPTVQLAFSLDGGRSFEAPATIDLGRPVGRVDVVARAGATALVSWIEQEESGAGVWMREVSRRGPDDLSVAAPLRLVPLSAARQSGFPRLVAAPWGGLILAWTEVGDTQTQLRVAHLDLPDAAAP
jgi:hypothetical protein